MRGLINNSGENVPVRCFLRGLECGAYTIDNMKQHLEESGFSGYWPAFVNDEKGHLDKQLQQIWLRYLFSLENNVTN